MPEETLGYVELEWSCPNCGTKNAGSRKTCVACGGAMNQGQQFEVPQDAKLLAEAAAAEAAKAAPDIHCGYCGTRNPATATRCSQCGAELSAGTARQAGQVLGAYGEGASGPSALTAAPAAKPGGRGLAIGCSAAIALVVLVVIGFVVLSSRTTDTVVRVQSTTWERAIAIQEQRPVAHSAWRDQVPGVAALGSCNQKERSIQDQPVPGAEKVCGTAYVVDQGTGKGKVVQNCRYRIMADYCTYTVPEWTVVNQVVARGSDLNPNWPALALGAAQRRGNNTETYKVTLLAGDKPYTYTPPDAATYAQFTPGSRWVVTVNALGRVNSVTPAR